MAWPRRRAVDGGGGVPASGGSDGSGLPLLIATALSIRTSSAASRWCSMLRSVATSRVSSIAEESSERLARVWIYERGGAARRRRRVRRRDDARVGAAACVRRAAPGAHAPGAAARGTGSTASHIAPSPVRATARTSPTAALSAARPLAAARWLLPRRAQHLMVRRRYRGIALSGQRPAPQPLPRASAPIMARSVHQSTQRHLAQRWRRRNAAARAACFGGIIAALSTRRVAPIGFALPLHVFMNRDRVRSAFALVGE